MTEFVDKIKESISCRDFAEHIGLTVNRAGFAVCPFHSDKDASLKIYNGNKGWCCFGCHKGGDVINMASLYYGTAFKETVKTLNDEFNLGFDLESPLSASERLALAVERARRKSLRLKEERLREAIERDYWRCFDRWLENERQIEMNEPRSIGDKFNDAFVSALRQRESIRYELECATERRCELYANK